MINAENRISQIEDGSPAQIWTESPDLADVIFGSNFEACAWASFFQSLQTHTHTHTHTSQ